MLRRPLDRVRLVAGLAAGVCVEGAAVVGCGLALAEVVGLDLVGIRAQPLPVNLVERVGLQDKAAHDAGARRGLHGDLDLAEHDVPFRCELGRVAGLCYCEGDAVGAVGGVALRCEAVRSRLEVDVDGASKGRVCGTVTPQCGVAVGVGLGERRHNEGGRGQSGECSYRGTHGVCEVGGVMATETETG